jgi:hypothetical protein
MMSATITYAGQTIGTISGPHEDVPYPWMFTWFSSRGPHRIVIWADEDADPGLAAIVTVMQISREREQDHLN